MKQITSLVLLLLLFTAFSTAQVSEDKLRSIDSLFTQWNTPDHPGGTVGISIDGVPVFRNAYGLASLEYMVPNSYGTRFNIASVSKQFTAMGIVKLHMEGKLSIDDDIRKHLPELPDIMGQKAGASLKKLNTGLTQAQEIFIQPPQIFSDGCGIIIRHPEAGKRSLK
ncbi:MAG: beta-lactamase family protein [Bacteroidales bacterium]|nr:beta-lactamase family protein [Bacteroidales bacterium]